MAELAERSGTTPHAFMLEAIEESVRIATTRAAISDEAKHRFRKLISTGRGLDWEETRRWLERKGSGIKARHPRARAWRK